MVCGPSAHELESHSAARHMIQDATRNKNTAIETSVTKARV
jgi:hypothetical protein